MHSLPFHFLSFAFILSLTGYSSLVLADLSSLPQCAQLCASTTATSFGCSGFDDKQCLCTRKDASGNVQNYPEAVLRCPGMALCSPDDTRATGYALNGFCDGIQVGGTTSSQNTTTTQQTTQQTTKQTTTSTSTTTSQQTTTTQQTTTSTSQTQQQSTPTSTTGTNDDTTTVFTTVLTTPTDTTSSDPNANLDGSGALGLSVTLTSLILGLAVGMVLLI